MPVTMMAPNIITVHPPKTQEGMVAGNAPIGGNNPAESRMTAPHIMVKRLTIFVMVIKPTFWLNDVMGRQPNTPADTALIKPSQLSEPDISCSVISRFNPPWQMAVVSPIVSAAETGDISDMEILVSVLFDVMATVLIYLQWLLCGKRLFVLNSL